MPTSIGMNATMPMHTHDEPSPSRHHRAVAVHRSPSCSSSCLSANQTKMVNYVNSSRRAVGLPAVKADADRLRQGPAVGRAHGRAPACVEHSGGGSRMSTAGPPHVVRRRRERRPRRSSTANAHDLWMKSASHKANILGSYNRVGTGVVRKGNYVYAVQIFYRTC